MTRVKDPLLMKQAPKGTGCMARPAPLTERRITAFWSRVGRGDGCWLWQGRKGRDGYGRMNIRHEPYYVHRLAYQIAHGAVPSGLFVCHHCDVKLCVRPDHLFAGTHQDNIRDAYSKGLIRRKAA